MRSRLGRWLVGAALLAMAMVLPAQASASPIAQLTYVETQLAGGNYQYDYTFSNITNPATDPGANLYDVFLPALAGPAFTGNLLSVLTPAGWDVNFGSSFADIFSLSPASDITIGSSLGGFRLTFDSKVGDLAFDAFFTNPNDPTNPGIYTGVSSAAVAPVPEPATLLLLGSGLVGGAINRARKRKAEQAALNA